MLPADSLFDYIIIQICDGNKLNKKQLHLQVFRWIKPYFPFYNETKE